MGDIRPKSQLAALWLGGEHGRRNLFQILKASSAFSLSFALSLDEIRSLTYREAWELFAEPIVTQRNDGGSTTSTSKPAGKAGAFDPTRATAEEMDSFLNQICGNKKYEGPRWWENPEAHGIKLYRG